MATPGIYYIDTSSFTDALSVYTDAALTICAPDGFYQVGRVSRQQVNCALLPPENCPSCAPEPTPVTPIPELNAYKVIKVSDQTEGFVVLNTNFNVTQRVLTDIDASGICWTIDSLVTNATTSVITGNCIETPPEDPTVYYGVEKCLTNTLNSAPALLYTSLSNNVGSEPTFNQLYLNPQNDVYYIYNNSNTTTPPGELVLNELEIITGETGCPALPAQSLYWNAQECSNPANRIVFKSDLTPSFTVGTTAVKIGGANGLCYTVLEPSTIETSVFYTGPYADCAACLPVSDNPPEIPPNGFVVTRDGAADNEVLDDADNPRSEGDTAVTSIDSECWTLGAPIKTTTGNTITGPCITVVDCTLYALRANTGGDATFYYNRCVDNELITVIILNGNSQEVCAKTDTAVAAVVGVGTVDVGVECEQAELVSLYDYYNVDPCSGSGGPQIISVSAGASVVIGQAIKLSNVCFTVVSISQNQIVGNLINLATDGFDNCNLCNGIPPPTTILLGYDLNTKCIATPTAIYYVDNATWGETTPTKLWSDLEFASSQAELYAAPGHYTFTYLPSTGTPPLSKYWDGAEFTAFDSCVTITQQEEFTITLEEINRDGITNGTLDEDYTIDGDQVGFTEKVKKGESFSFRTKVAIINNALESDPADPITVNNFGVVNCQADERGTTVIQGNLIEKVVDTWYVELESCGNGTTYTVETLKEPRRGVGQIAGIYRRVTSGGPFDTLLKICGRITNISRTKPSPTWTPSSSVTYGDFNPVGGCTAPFCEEAMNQGY